MPLLDEQGMWFRLSCLHFLCDTLYKGKEYAFAARSIPADRYVSTFGDVEVRFSCGMTLDSGTFAFDCSPDM